MRSSREMIRLFTPYSSATNPADGNAALVHPLNMIAAQIPEKITTDLTRPITIPAKNGWSHDQSTKRSSKLTDSTNPNPACQGTQQQALGLILRALEPWG